MLTEFEHILRCRESASTPPITRFQEDQSFTVMEKSEGITRLPDSASTVELPMLLIAEGLFIYILSSSVIDLYVGDPLVVTAQPGTFFVHYVPVGSGFTEVHLKNDNGASTVATVEYYIAGDAT